MRLFVGIPLDPALAAGLERAVTTLRRAGDGLRWTSPDSWHITLQFLGNATAEQYRCLLDCLPRVRFSPVPIAVGTLGCFNRSGVFIATIVPSPELLSLAAGVQAATAGCGFSAEPRPYQPHITLARSKGHDRSLKSLVASLPEAPAFARFEAAEFLLYESHLGPGGSRYEVRARFPLAR